MKKWMIAGLAALLLGAGVFAEEIVMKLQPKQGLLTAMGLEPGSTCTVEWASTLPAGFTNIFPDFEGVLVDSNGIAQVAVPMFFRARGTPALTAPDGMVQIPAGTNAGTNPLAEGESYESYYPETYSLTVDAFYMDETEVTKAEWDTVYNWAVTNGYSFDNAGSGKAEDHPVHTVSWYDCVKWCNARSEREGKVPCYTVTGSTYKTGQSSPDCDFDANGYRLCRRMMSGNTQHVAACKASVSRGAIPSIMTMRITVQTEVLIRMTLVHTQTTHLT